ncbi:BtaA family protein, partial [bacterium]|nr:BtaA family protein [bacterium]
ISSGGCNVLNYLTYNPAAVHAVDLNPNHLRLARLRIAAVRHLPDYPALLRFFGNANTRENIALYERYIKPHLPKEEQQFWQGPLLSNRIGWFEKGLYDSSRSGYFIRFLHFLCRRAGCHPEKLLTAQSMEEQELLFEKHIGPTFDSWPVKFLGKLPVMLYSLGIPPQQFEALLEDEDDIIQLYRSRVKRLACNFPIQENYFAWQALARTYNTSEQRALPLYLQERHYHGVKSRLERITTQLTTTVQFLEHSSPRSLNAFVFLDSQDWMTSEQMTAQWSAVAAAGEQGARVIFRTAGKSSPIETALPPELRSRFQYHEQLSRELYEEDRSAVYGGFHLYELIS